MNTFNLQSYTQQLNTFPNISYSEFEQITDLKVRKDIIKKNKILKTDAYNRTMTQLRGDKGTQIETFTLSFRKNAAQSFNVIYGIKDKLLELFGTPLTQAELDFAADFYAAQKTKGGNAMFNKDIWQEVIDNHSGFIPLQIKAVADGTPVRAFEPIMSVTGPGEFAAIYEPVFMRTFFQSTVATDGLIINQLMHEGRIAEDIYADEFGARSVINRDQHFDADEALIVGAGLQATSSDATAAVYPQLRSSGTIAHRYLAAYPTEDEAFLNAVEKSDKISLLIDLVDSYKGIEKAIALKKKYRHTGKKIGIRLDSGDLLDQTLYALRRYKEEGLIDPTMDKIIVADISSSDEIEKIEKAVYAAGFNPRDHIYYGLGELLIAKNKTRSRVSAGYKLTKTNGRNTGKLSNDEGKIPVPGKLNIEITENQRVIVQDDEEVLGKRLLHTVYENGILNYDTNDIVYINNARKNLIDNFSDINKPTTLSPKTQDIVKEVKDAFIAQMN